MPLDPVRVGLAVQSGVSIVCATCQKYWQGRDKGLPGAECTATKPCGSPLAGGEFSEYVGPITVFDRWCFVCGDSATHGVRIAGKTRTFGMCDDHVQWLHQLAPVDVDGPELEREVHRPDGSLVAASSLVKKRKQSLGEFIYEVEKYYADKEGREL